MGFVAKHQLLQNLLGNLPEPVIFRQRIENLSDDDLRQIINDADRLLLKAVLDAALKKVDSLRVDNHKLRRRLQNVLMQADLTEPEHTPIDGTVSHINYKNTRHITGKFDRKLLAKASDEQI